MPCSLQSTWNKPHQPPTKIDDHIAGEAEAGTTSTTIAHTASNAGLDGRTQVYIGCGHPIQKWAPHHRVNQGPIQIWWQNAQATEFDLVNN
ncbi:hypothetical protein PCANC_20229 [Puccinia coronata f. sp. avenae]|uniref:Uncharacterized protein n=1 Tax=Puccinia coronata f. sp. avenae TaxID=200324 RepID=A0A2N5U3Y7_9BASI|nr:hypothetical protein PCANC_20229 [Puccinia coronata f. sp. avenae]